jgi:hypothetical protein
VVIAALASQLPAAAGHASVGSSHGAASTGHSQTEASAVVKVVVTVQPQVTVSAKTAVVNAATVASGDFAVTIGYHVDSTSQRVDLYVSATDLYMGDVTNDKGTPAIPVNVSRGVSISAPTARALGGSGIASFTGTGTVDGVDAHNSESLRFETTQKNTGFSQDVQVTVTWGQNDTEKPPGQYGGRVRLTAMVMP